MKILEFIYSEFSTLVVYLRDHVKLVVSVLTDKDRSRQDIFEEIFGIFETAVNLDYSFLLSKGEEVCAEFLNFLDAVYKKSFSMKLRLISIKIIKSFYMQ